MIQQEVLEKNEQFQEHTLRERREREEKEFIGKQACSGWEIQESEYEYRAERGISIYLLLEIYTNKDK